MRRFELVLLVCVLASLLACRESRPPSDLDLREIVEEFNGHRERGESEQAGQMVSQNPRLWYGEKSGFGEPWEVTGAVDEWFLAVNGQTSYDYWEVLPDRVSASATTTTDFDTLLFADPFQHRVTWFFDGGGKICGFLVVQLTESGSRFDEFADWLDQYPRRAAEVFDEDGYLIRTRRSGLRQIGLAQEWRETLVE